MNGWNNITPSEPRSRMMQRPAFYSSLPPLSLSPSSLRNHPLRSLSLSPKLLRGSSSLAHVEDIDSSIRINENPTSPPSIMRHYRSVSVDSCFNDFLELPLSPTSSVDGDCANTLDLEFGKDEYTADELKKILKSTKLTEGRPDPKEVRRILANREAATRSKKRKSQYLIDLECRIKFLEKAITLMQKKEKLLEKDKQLLVDEKEEIRIRLESLKQQTKLHPDDIESLKATTTLNEQVSVEAQRLKEVLTSNEQLIIEVQRLKMVIGKVMHNDSQSDGLNIYQIDPNMFQKLTINESNQPHTDKQP
ncbi:PREDICTED: probable transcription factor PosF21 [Camelina sativa]|uniref:Probable transcription factor PosF21 n=1 Tax=Camelina sativa TaxID=90675 RepID=A0ABM0WBE7_CAMSA|nr:PREDICTED: probable transcription factor PosF21 [Camelina sativa]